MTCRCEIAALLGKRTKRMSPRLYRPAAGLSKHADAHIQSRFRTATFSLVGGADTEQFSVGAENVHYEGPLQIQLQVCFDCQEPRLITS